MKYIQSSVVIPGTYSDSLDEENKTNMKRETPMYILRGIIIYTLKKFLFYRGKKLPVQ